MIKAAAVIGDRPRVERRMQTTVRMAKQVCWLARYTGIEALAAAKFGIKIELTPWQKQNLAMMRRLFDHARMCGIRCWHEVTWHMPWLATEPGSMPYYDGVQTAEFLRRYRELTGKKVPTVPYE